MRSFPRRAAIVVLCTSLALTAVFARAQIPLATDAPPPLPPEESLKLIRVPAGLRVKLVAAEPLLADPVAVAFDAAGRIFVCEMHGYNMEGYFDVVELNKTGVLDKAVRRIPAPPEAQRKAEEQQYGTIKLLEDRDGDGRMDRAVVWADHLPVCYGIVPARDGLVALCSRQILLLADRDGDGRAEVRDLLFEGFGVREFWSRINNPRWGLDNWIYAAGGIGTGGTITGPHLKEPVKIPAICFRFKADGSALEPVSGQTSGFGQTFDDWGRRFLVTNQQHALLIAPLEYRYLMRNPFFAAPNPTVNISSYGHPARVFPVSRPDPWRLARARDPEWVKFYGALEATANGYVTSACGPEIYRAEEFPREYWGDHFSADCAQNMLHRCQLAPDGPLLTARRPKGEEQSEFLVSTEQWFRPVNLALGPDGALYVVDMYRSVIEDYSAIPRYLQQIYIKELIAGMDKGRLYRIVADRAGKPAPVDLAAGPAARWVAALEHGNAWWRRTAQRLLVERNAREATPALLQLARHGPTPQSRLHALYALEGLEALAPETVEAALGDAHPAVRRHGLILAERWLDASPVVAQRVLSMTDDPDSGVRQQLALSLGAMRDPRALDALWSLARRGAADTWIQAAILCSLGERSGALLTRLLKAEGAAGEARQLTHALASVVGARHDAAEVTEVLAAIAAAEGPPLDALEGLVEGLKRGKAVAIKTPAAQQAVGRLLAQSDPRIQDRAGEIAALLGQRDTTQLVARFDEAAKTACDAQRPLAERVAAMAVLQRAGFRRAAPVARQLLDPHVPLDLQLAAVRLLAAYDDAEATAALLANWGLWTPPMHAAILDALFSRQPRLMGLLLGLDRRAIPLSALDSNRRQQLLTHPNADVRHRAESLLGTAATSADRQPVLAQYTAALAGPRDAQRGKAVFDKQCAKCHQVQGQGFVVGPDLSVITRKSDEMLVSDVLDPNNQITVGFNRYTVVADDGRIFEGVLAAETATSITLRKEEGVETTLLRRDIDEIAAGTASMMPEGLEKEVTPQDLADLIAFLRSAFAAPAKK